MLQGSFPRVCLARLTSAILCYSTFIKVAMDYRLSSAAAFKPQCITFPVTRKKKLWQKCKRQQSKMKSLRTTLHFFHFNSIRRMRSLSHFTAFAMPWNGRRLVEKKLRPREASLRFNFSQAFGHCISQLFSPCFYISLHLMYLHFTHTLRRTCQSLTVNHALARVPNAKTAVLIENPQQQLSP